MTVEDTSYSPDVYNGNGSTTTFAITFTYLDDDHIVVKKIDTSTTPYTVTTLTNGVEYNITGGSVVTTAGNTFASGEKCWIGRVTPQTQATDLKNYSTLDAEDLEDALDKTILLSQEREEEISRTIKFSTTSGLSDKEIDATSLTAGYYVRVNSAGDGFDLVALSTTGSITVTAFGETLLDDTDAATALSTLGLTATAAELNILDGIDAVNDEDDMSSDSATALSTQQSIKAYVDRSTPAGAVMPFAMDSVPAGWLECDGSAVSRTTYATLFSAIGTVFGVGDGSTTFNVPDLRGQFIRGYDHGAGTDPDAASRTDSGDGSTTGDNVGTKQADDFEAHDHTIGYDETWTG